MHLGSVKAWVIYAKQQNILHKSWRGIEVGDVIIFDQLMEGPLDHLGIVVEVHANYILCSEGNFYNKSGIFKRNKDNTIWGYIRL